MIRYDSKHTYFCICFTVLSCQPIVVYIGHCNQQKMKSEDVQCNVLIPYTNQGNLLGEASTPSAFHLVLEHFLIFFLSRFPTLLSCSRAPPYCCYRAAAAVVLQLTQEPCPFPLPNLTRHPPAQRRMAGYRDAVGAIVAAAFLGAFGSCSSLKEQLNLQRYLSV